MLSFITYCPKRQQALFFLAFITLTLRMNGQLKNQGSDIEINSRILDEALEFVVKDIDQAEFRFRQKIEILNEKDPYLLHFQQYSDQQRKLNDLKISIFDSSGSKQEKMYTIKDMDMVAAPNHLVSDGKYIYFAIPYSRFPFVYEISFSIKFHGLINYPDYNFINANQLVEHSSYTITVPENLDIKYKNYDCDLKPSRSIDHGKISYKWELNHVKPIAGEASTASYEQILPRVVISPVKFKLDQYEGSMESWQSFGKWYDTLSKNERALPEKYKAELKNMVIGAKDDKEKAALIYEYLQQNFRYVLIRLGIGGFKPASATSTYNTKYGDCKALSNFMQASLSEVGIRSYQCLINAAHNQLPVDESFPNNSFNHVIVCIPQTKDSIWLECTSQENELGELGSFTENRRALLISEQGGRLVSTPTSRSTSNQLNSQTDITLQEDGSGSAVLKLQATGDFKSRFIAYLVDNEEQKKKEFLVNQLNLKPADQYQIKSAKENRMAISTIQLEYDLLPEMMTAKKIFLNKSLYSLCNEEIPATEHRMMDYYFKFPYIKTDTTTYHLPPVYVLESNAESKNISTDYFNYSEKISFNQQTSLLQVISSFELKKHIVAASDYHSMLAAYHDIQDYMNKKLIISK